jgi:hypothetical protein
MVSLFSEDEKKSTCQKLIDEMQLQRYVFNSSNGLFKQGARFIFPIYEEHNLAEYLINAKISFTEPMNDMFYMKAISPTKIKSLLEAVGIHHKSEANTNSLKV